MSPGPGGMQLRLLGPALCLALVVAHVRLSLPERPPAWLVRAAERARPRRDPARMCARDLRRLPGVGTRLAERIVAERERALASGRTLTWTDVRGIGEKTASRIRSWLVLHGVPPDAPLASSREIRSGTSVGGAPGR